MIVPSFESHQCLAGMWKRQLSCHVGCQEVSRCCTRGESQGTCTITHMPPLSLNKAEPTLALKPRGEVTRSPKQGYQWPHKKDSCPPKKIFKKKRILQPNKRRMNTKSGAQKAKSSWFWRQVYIANMYIHIKLLTHFVLMTLLTAKQQSLTWNIKNFFTNVLHVS